MIALTPWGGVPDEKIYCDPADVEDVVPIGDSGVTIVETSSWTHYVKESAAEVRSMVEGGIAGSSATKPVYREGLIADE